MIRIKPYYVVIKFVQGSKTGQYRAWKDYDENHVWGSPLYEILGYEDNYKDAQKLINNDVYLELKEN